MGFEDLKGILEDAELNYLKEGKEALGKIQITDDNGMTAPEVMQKILIVANNCNLIIKHLKDARSARIKFMNSHKSWIGKRRETTKKLKEIGNAINSDRFNCNVSRIVSTITSIAGGGCMLASAILIPFTGGLSVPLGIAGGSLIAAGNASNFGTSLTEVIRVKANVDEAQKLIKEDKELFEKMGSWMEHSETLNKAQSEVLEIDILEDIISSVKKLVDKGMKKTNTQKRKRYIEKKITKIIKSTKKTMNIPIIGIKTLISLLMGIFVIMGNRECRFLFDCANLTIRALTGSVVLADEITGLVGCCVAGCAPVVAKAAVRGAFATIGLTLDVASIVLTSIDIHKGSFNSQAQTILKVAEGIEKEAEELENVYNNLVNSESRFRA